MLYDCHIANSDVAPAFGVRVGKGSRVLIVSIHLCDCRQWQCTPSSPSRWCGHATSSSPCTVNMAPTHLAARASDVALPHCCHHCWCVQCWSGAVDDSLGGGGHKQGGEAAEWGASWRMVVVEKQEDWGLLMAPNPVLALSTLQCPPPFLQEYPGIHRNGTGIRRNGTSKVQHSSDSPSGTW